MNDKVFLVLSKVVEEHLCADEGQRSSITHNL